MICRNKYQMQEPRRIRKRISITKRPAGALLVDPLEYVANRSSKNARKIDIQEEKVFVHLWYDKHYCNRFQHGDESGKREGIEPLLIRDTIAASIAWLITCSGLYKFFRFLNHKKEGDYFHRIVLQKQTNEGLLNIVTEFHWMELLHYEVTVKTAMVTDTFRLSDGQFAFCLNDSGCVIMKMENNKPREVVQV